MRQIKFRGQCLGSKKWVYGSIITSDDGAQIHVAHNELYAVDPETVGQFIGLLDIDGVKIFDGDIVDYVCDGSKQGIIIYDNFGCVSIEFGDDEYLQTIDARLLGTMEVVGNIHDNPESLKNE